jgi:hypothetical protein
VIYHDRQTPPFLQTLYSRCRSRRVVFVPPVERKVEWIAVHEIVYSVKYRGRQQYTTVEYHQSRRKCYVTRAFYLPISATTTTTPQLGQSHVATIHYLAMFETRHVFVGQRVATWCNLCCCDGQEKVDHSSREAIKTNPI